MATQLFIYSSNDFDLSDILLSSHGQVGYVKFLSFELLVVDEPRSINLVLKTTQLFIYSNDFDLSDILLSCYGQVGYVKSLSFELLVVNEPRSINLVLEAT